MTITRHTILSKAIFLLTLMLLAFVHPTSAQMSGGSNPTDPPDKVFTPEDNEIVPPSYPGGERAMYGYLAQSVRYPRKARKHHTSGKVVVTAIVEKDGSLSNVTILEDIGDGCGEAVMKSVKRMQRWHCATKDRIPVRYQVRIPVTFRL